MTHKERRDRLFKKGRPHFRKVDLINADGSYGADMGILWAAYKAGSFRLAPDLTQEKFAEWISGTAKRFTTLWLGEDESKVFKSGKGPVGIVGSSQEGLLVSLEWQALKWASKKNILRSCVAFLHMVTKSRSTGICAVKGTKEAVPLLDHLKDYGLLYYIGKTNPDEYLYSVRGRGSEKEE